MRQCIDDTFDYLIKAKTPIILVNTYEEERFINDMCDYASEHNLGLSTWSLASGLDEYSTINKQVAKHDEKVNFDKLMKNFIQARQNNDLNESDIEGSVMYIIKDSHLLMDNASMKRIIRDTKEYKYKTYCPLIFMTPVVSIPTELEKLITIFNYDLPSETEVTGLVNGIIDALRKKYKDTFVMPDDDLIRATIKSLMGLTFNEIKYILTRSAVQYKNLNLDLISQCKVNMVERSGLLDYIIPKISFDDIGGNESFKAWINDVSEVLTDSAKEFGCEAPQGYMALGIAGTGKTIIAEAIAKKLGVPMFIFNVSKIFDKLVGQSEKQVEQALRTVKASAPCVLLFDEAEKIFGGYSGSDCDGGTSSRVFSSILRFLAENEKVFVVMTSNDISKLPPELTRSGRLDTMWYFGFPTIQERMDIFKIHFKKAGQTVSNDIIEYAANNTDKFTGSEIKNVVKQTVWQAYKRFKETNQKSITIDDVEYAIAKIVPTYNTSREKILALEQYAKGRALFANSIERDQANKSTKSIINDADLNDLINEI